MLQKLLNYLLFLRVKVVGNIIIGNNISMAQVESGLILRVHICSYRFSKILDTDQIKRLK
jgi:hypothetical protein